MEQKSVHTPPEVRTYVHTYVRTYMHIIRTYVRILYKQKTDGENHKYIRMYVHWQCFTW